MGLAFLSRQKRRLSERWIGNVNFSSNIDKGGRGKTVDKILIRFENHDAKTMVGDGPEIGPSMAVWKKKNGVSGSGNVSSGGSSGTW